MLHVIVPNDVGSQQSAARGGTEVGAAFPEPNDWFERYGGCPWLYGPIDGQVDALRNVLLSLKDSDGRLDTEIFPSGSSRPQKISSYARRLASSGIVKQAGDILQLTPDADKWLAAEDDEMLCGILHSRLRFFGEVLFVLKNGSGITHAGLHAIAVSAYGLEWATLDPVRKRVGWLRSLGLVELSFDGALILTGAGLSALDRLKIYHPTGVTHVDSGPLEEIRLPKQVEELLSGLTPESLSARKIAFGYVPRSNHRNIYESLLWLTTRSKSEGTRADFCASCMASFDVKESSAVSALYTVKSLGIIEQCSIDGYRPTVAAEAWVDSSEPLALVAIIHAHLLCVGEILALCSKGVKAPNVKALVADVFGVHLTLSEVRSRLHLLCAAGAIEQLAPGKYRRTARGESLMKHLPLLGGVKNAVEDGAVEGRHVEGRRVSAALLVEELRLASLDSANPTRFERAVQEALSWLGYRAHHLGGAGRTDVLVDFEPEAGAVSHFIVDTKASGAGAVNDGMVKFDALRDHLLKHNGEFAVLVAHSFGGGRIVKWAQANSVSLVTVEVLAQVLSQQEIHPVGMQALTEFFREGDSGLAALKDAWRSMGRSIDLAMEVVDRLRLEYEGADAETAGTLTGEQLYFLLRDAIEPRPTKEAITAILDLLSSSLLMGVQPLKNARFLMADPPVVLARRLRNLADRLEHIDREGDEA